MSYPITVELHGFTSRVTPPVPGQVVSARREVAGDIDGPTDVTRFVSFVRWTHSVRAPWETIDLTLSIPRRFIGQVLPGALFESGDRMWRQPRPGFWVVVRYEGTAVAWGRADAVRYSISTAGRARGMVSTQDVSIRCSSWLELLQRSRVLQAPALRSELDGFIYRAQSWGATLSTALQAFSYKPGGLFQAMWQQMVRVQIPATLTPNSLDAVTIGDEIPIAHDAASVATYAPARGPQHLDVEGVNINAIGSQALPNGTVWDTFATTFGADPNLVEMFPSLENGATGESRLQASLGAQPVIVYRLKPWLLEPIDQFHTAGEQGLYVAPRTYSQEVGWFQTPIQREPAAGARDYVFRGRDITEYTLIWSDSERVNATFVQTPLQGQDTSGLSMGLLGRPARDEVDIPRHGLRLYQAEWPFFPPSSGEGDQSSLQAKIEALNEYAWVIMGEGQEFASGSVTTVFRPTVKAGHWVALHFPPLDVDRLANGNEEHDLFPVLNGYVESVQHSVRVDRETGTQRAETTLDFVRGSADAGGQPLTTRIRSYGGEPIEDFALPGVLV